MTTIRVACTVLATMCMTLARGADAPSPLVGHSFAIYYRAVNVSGISEVHRSVLVFSPQGVSSEVFPGGGPIPFTGTLAIPATPEQLSRDGIQL